MGLNDEDTHMIETAFWVLGVLVCMYLIVRTADLLLAALIWACLSVRDAWREY
jgi:hypothetical protein